MFGTVAATSTDWMEALSIPSTNSGSRLQQIFVIDVGAPQGVAIQRGEQPLQLELGARRHPQADVHVAQLHLVLLLDPVEAEQQTRGEHQQGEGEQAVPSRSGLPDALHRTCRAFSCQTDFSLVAKSSSSGWPDQG